MKINLSQILLLILVVACRDDDDLPAEGLELVWEYQYAQELDYGTQLPHIGPNEVLYFRDGDETSSNDYLLSLDKLTGQLNWEWSDGIPSSNFTTGNNFGVFLNNVFYFQNASRFFGVNLSTGDTQIKALTPSEVDPLSCSGGCEIFVDNSTIYRSASRGDYSIIIQTNPSNGFSQELIEYDISDPNILEGGFATPEIYTLNSGEKIMVTTCGTLNLDFKSTPYYCSINMNDYSLRDEIQLDVTEFNNGIDDHDVYEGKAYIASNRMISCIDIESGTIVWQTDMPGDFLFSKIVVADGKVMGSRSNDFKTVVLDANNGNIIWERDLIRADVVNMQYHNGIMYFVASGRLFVVDANNGNILEELQTPSVLQGNTSDYFNNAVVDPQSGLLFTQSFTTAYAYKLYR